ncbi:MAG: D-alanyl-D-alanine carboxypeptidase [Alphaproteobacteria bacterium]|nr:D-alanyl-D-alanine carboxypeptidase [Alphaproteobacteria bacterium]
MMRFTLLKQFLFILLICLMCLSEVVAKKKIKNLPVSGSQKSSTAAPVADTVKPELPNSTIPMDVEVLAKQAILVDYQTGTVLLQKRAEEPMHPSSMTKIMTAYLAIEKIKNKIVSLETPITVSRNGWRVEGSSMFLNIKDVVKVEDLLKGIIIQSGNDASIVLAEGLSGSEEAFAAEMTRCAHEMGATNTTFKNATGLPHPQHLTTAKDLITMAVHALKDHPEFYHLYGEKNFTYGNITQGNRNPLLYKNIGCDGIKTGKTEIAGFGMVASCVQQGQRFILVINGMPSMQARADEATKLITWAMRTFANYHLFKADQIIEKIPVWNGKENFLPVTIEKDAIISLARVGRADMKVKLQYNAPVLAPIKKGTNVGKIIVTSSALPNPIEIPLVAAEAIEKAGFFKCLTDSISHLFGGS